MSAKVSSFLPNVIDGCDCGWRVSCDLAHEAVTATGWISSASPCHAPDATSLGRPLLRPQALRQYHLTQAQPAQKWLASLMAGLAL